MKSKKLFLAALIGIALVFSFPLLAQKEGTGSCEKACGIPNLTTEQTAKIQKLAFEHQKALLSLQTALKTKQLELRQMMMEGADQKKLEAKIDELAKARADIQKKCLAHRSEIRNLLTDEQKKAFDQKCGGVGCGAGFGQGCGKGKNKCGSEGCSGHETGRMAQHRCGQQSYKSTNVCFKR